MNWKHGGRPTLIGVLVSIAISVCHVWPCNAEPPITALAFTTDHLEVIAGSQRGLLIYKWPDLDQKRVIDCGLDSIHDVSPSLDGKHLLIGGGTPGSKGVVQLRTWPELELRQTWQDHRDVVYQVAWRADGLECVSVGWDGTCNVYEVGSLANRTTMSHHSAPLFAATYLDGNFLATAGSDRTIVVSDSSSGKVIRSLTQHTQSIHALAYQPTGAETQPRLLASASDDRTVRFWQAEIGRLVRFHRFASIPRAIVWRRAGTQLIVGCDDGTVHMLDPSTLSAVVIAKQNVSIQNVIMDASNGHILVSGGDALWSVVLP